MTKEKVDIEDLKFLNVPMPDINPETRSIPRLDNLQRVGLTPEEATQFAATEARERLRLPRAEYMGGINYQQLEAGLIVDRIETGKGEITISADSSQRFTKEIIRMAGENAIPGDEAQRMLTGIANTALVDPKKSFDIAVDCFNYLSDKKLDGSPYMSQLVATAQTIEEKYRLAHALDEAIPAPPTEEFQAHTSTPVGEPILGATPQFPPDSLPTFDSDAATTINNTNDASAAIDIPTIQPTSVETATPTYMPLEPKFTPNVNPAPDKTLRPVTQQQEPVQTGRLQSVFGGIKGVAETLVAPKGPQQ